MSTADRQAIISGALAWWASMLTTDECLRCEQTFPAHHLVDATCGWSPHCVGCLVQLNAEVDAEAERQAQKWGFAR